MGCPDVIESHCQQGTQHPAAVHWERRQQVEHRQRHVHPEELVHKAAADLNHVANWGQSSAQSQAKVESGGQHHVDGRPGERHDQFLLGVVGHPFQPRHAADGQESNVARADAVTPSSQRMP